MGYVSAVRQLLAQPGIEFDLNQLNSILLLAVHQGDAECVRLLLNIPNLDANITYPIDHGLTSLMIACDKNHIEIVKLLLASTNTNINTLSRRGNVALMFAICKGHDDCARLLLENDKIDPNIINQDGEAIITLCAAKSSEETVKALLSKPGLDVNVQNKNGNTALICAAKRNPSLAELFLTIDGIDTKKVNNLNEYFDIESRSLSTSSKLAFKVFNSEQSTTQLFDIQLTEGRLGIGVSESNGLRINDIVVDSLAYKQGLLKVEDEIIELDGKVVKTEIELIECMKSISSMPSVSLKVRRGNEKLPPISGSNPFDLKFTPPATTTTMSPITFTPPATLATLSLPITFTPPATSTSPITFAHTTSSLSNSPAPPNSSAPFGFSFNTVNSLSFVPTFTTTSDYKRVKDVNVNINTTRNKKGVKGKKKGTETLESNIAIYLGDVVSITEDTTIDGKSSNADLNLLNFNLFQAVKNRCLNEVKKLMSEGADMDHVCIWGNERSSIWNTVIKTCDHELMEILLTHIPSYKLDRKISVDGLTVFMLIASLGSLKCLR